MGHLRLDLLNADLCLAGKRSSLEIFAICCGRKSTRFRQRPYLELSELGPTAGLPPNSIVKVPDWSAQRGTSVRVLSHRWGNVGTRMLGIALNDTVPCRLTDSLLMYAVTEILGVSTTRDD